MGFRHYDYDYEYLSEQKLHLKLLLDGDWDLVELEGDNERLALLPGDGGRAKRCALPGDGGRAEP